MNDIEASNAKIQLSDNKTAVQGDFEEEDDGLNELEKLAGID